MRLAELPLYMAGSDGCPYWCWARRIVSISTPSKLLQTGEMYAHVGFPKLATMLDREKDAHSERHQAIAGYSDRCLA